VTASISKLEIAWEARIMPTRLTAIAVGLLSWLALTTATAEPGEECTTPNGTIYIVHREGEVCSACETMPPFGVTNNCLPALQTMSQQS